MFEVSELLDLLAGKRLCLRVPGFVPPQACRQVVERILEPRALELARNTTGLSHQQLVKLATGAMPDPDRSYARGMSYYETKHESGTGWDTVASGRSHRAYYALSAEAKALTRRLFAPYPTPMESFMAALERLWPPGARTLDLGDGEMFFGLLRVLSDEVLAHEDKLERDHGPLPDDLGYVTQLAVNAYLQVPPDGGELLLWNRSLDDTTYDAMRGSTYGIAHARLGRPDERIRPGTGELVLFDARKLHGVSASQGRQRVSMSSFLMYCGPHRPLNFWS